MKELIAKFVVNFDFKALGKSLLCVVVFMIAATLVIAFFNAMPGLALLVSTIALTVLFYDIFKARK